MAGLTEELEEDFDEVPLAEYLMLLFAVDKFAGHVEEQTSTPANDKHTVAGITMLRRLDTQFGDAMQKHLIDKIPTETTKAMVQRTFRVRLTNETQVGRRVLSLRTALNRNTAVTLKAIFEESRPRNAVKASQ